MCVCVCVWGGLNVPGAPGVGHWEKHSANKHRAPPVGPKIHLFRSRGESSRRVSGCGTTLWFVIKTRGSEHRVNKKRRSLMSRIE